MRREAVRLCLEGSVVLAAERFLREDYDAQPVHDVAGRPCWESPLFLREELDCTGRTGV